MSPEIIDYFKNEAFDWESEELAIRDADDPNHNLQYLEEMICGR